MSYSCTPQEIFKEVQKVNRNGFCPKQFTTSEEFWYILWGSCLMYFSKLYFISLFSFFQYYMLQYNLKLANMFAGFLLLFSCEVKSNGWCLYLICEWGCNIQVKIALIHISSICEPTKNTSTRKYSNQDQYWFCSLKNAQTVIIKNLLWLKNTCQY